jgi:hypothetical protein
MPDEPAPTPVEDAKEELAAALAVFVEGTDHLRAAIHALDEEEALAEERTKERTPASAAK